MMEGGPLPIGGQPKAVPRPNDPPFVNPDAGAPDHPGLPIPTAPGADADKDAAIDQALKDPPTAQWYDHYMREDGADDPTGGDPSTATVPNALGGRAYSRLSLGGTSLLDAVTSVNLSPVLPPGHPLADSPAATASVAECRSG